MMLDPNSARKEFERILQDAHSYNRVMAGFVVQAMTQTDPIKSAEALDKAILAAETMANQFRIARRYLSTAFPNFSLPQMPKLPQYPTRGALSRPPPPRVF
jgi:hypothetical protein